MDVAIVIGSSGLIGAEATRFFSQTGFTVVDIDNDMHRILEEMYAANIERAASPGPVND